MMCRLTDYSTRGHGHWRSVTELCLAIVSRYMASGVRWRRLAGMVTNVKNGDTVRKDPQLDAKAAGLRYVDSEEPGWQRKPWGRGFTYLDLDGNHLGDGAERDRIEQLVIPPAWTDVWICPDENGHIQATGRDAKGRKQYIYHARWQELRNENKFARMIQFGLALPEIRARVDQDLRRHGVSRERVLAAVVRLLQESMIRVGNPEYARDNGSFGLTTMLADHLELSGTRLQFEFKGKSGKMQNAEVRDPRLARVVRQLQELPGQELFQYVDDDGQRRVVESGDVNAYVNEATDRPERFSAKDFRTWGGTCEAVRFLQEIGPPANEKEAEANIVALYKEVAECLGNTPAVCREYYVHPVVAHAYRRGTFFDVCKKVARRKRKEWLRLEEEIALALLEMHLEDELG